jgi:ribosomal protein S11
VAQTSTGATITITDATGTTTATVTNGTAGAKGDKGDPGDDYVLTAQDKTDIAEIVSENGLFYETHCNGQVFNV